MRRTGTERIGIQVRTGDRARPECITLGVPFARGQCRDISRLSVEDRKQNPCPSQAAPQAFHDDGSVRWALIHFLGTLPGNARTNFSLCLDRTPKAPEQPLHVVETGPLIQVDTGALQFEVDTSHFRGLENVRIPSFDRSTFVSVAEAPESGSLQIIDAAGRMSGCATGKVVSARVLSSGPLVCRIHLEGTLSSNDSSSATEKLRPLEYELWLEAWAGQTHVRAWLTLRNPNPAIRRVTGQWPLGLQGSIYFKDLSWQIEAPQSQSGVSYATLHAGHQDEIYRGPFNREALLFQASSGGEHWFHRNHVNREWRIPLAFRGYKACVDGTEIRQADRADVWTALSEARTGVAVGVRHSWQNFPKALRVEKNKDGRLTLSAALWPREHDDLHELQGGEQKTHELVISFLRNDGSAPGLPVPFRTWRETEEEMGGLLNPPFAFVDIAQYAHSGAFDHLAPYTPRARTYEHTAQGGVADAERNLFTAREAIDEYGWRNFGDVWADNEAGGRILSHYNLEYDMAYGMLLQAVRTTDAKPEWSDRWWQLAEAAARHECDIDVYHAPDDPHNGAVYSFGKFTHTDHGYEVGRSTHRGQDEESVHGDLKWGYHGGQRGGGPESGHFCTRGMLTYALMSGYPPPLRVAREMADLVHRKVTTENFPQWGFDRTSGHNLQVLLEAYKLTGDRRYLESCPKIIACSHPDVLPWGKGLPAKSGFTLWTGGIFLKEVARWLELCEAEGRSDDRARTCILRAAEIYNQYGWDEKAGRYAHSLNADGTHFRYDGEPWWDLKIVETVAWACRWQDDGKVRREWLRRARKNFQAACKLFGTGHRGPFYRNAKGVTVATSNGPGFLALERLLSSRSVRKELRKR